MSKIVVTYDVTEGNDQSYYNFFDFAKERDAQQLTESTYLFPRVVSVEWFERKIRSLFSKGDTVFIIGVNDECELFCKQIYAR